MHYRTLGSNPDLYPLDVNSSPPPSVLTTESVSRQIAKCLGFSGGRGTICPQLRTTAADKGILMNVKASIQWILRRIKIAAAYAPECVKDQSEIRCVRKANTHKVLLILTCL